MSDYALVRRQFHIFERALKKFKSDIGLWIQYIQVAKKEGARSLVGRITARYVVLTSPSNSKLPLTSVSMSRLVWAHLFRASQSYETPSKRSRILYPRRLT